MPHVQRKRAKEICHESSCKFLLTIQAGRLASVILRFSLLLLIFLNSQTFGEALNFCFQGPKEGYRLNSTVIKYVHVQTEVDCLLLCMRQDKSCRSINFRKTSNCDNNCELLKDIGSERPDLLLEDDQFDYYILLDPKGNRKPSSTSRPQITQKSSTIKPTASKTESSKTQPTTKSTPERTKRLTTQPATIKSTPKKTESSIIPPEIIKSTPTKRESSTTQSTTIMKSSSCSDVDWRERFNKRGLSKCGKDNLFITGFYRDPPNGGSDPISLLKEARCCTSIPEFSEQNGECEIANWKPAGWWSHNNNKHEWSLCPWGFFLNGLYRNNGNELQSIEKGRCCRPINHPHHYGSCYDEDVEVSFDKKGWSNCSKAGYYITGVYRGPDAKWLRNIDRFRCCQMALAIMKPSTCSNVDWTKSFDTEGLSKCGKDNLFITGLYRQDPPNGGSDPISLLEKARCCTSIPEFSEQNGTCKISNWRRSAGWWSRNNNKNNNRGWSFCPWGFFLNGLYRNVDSQSELQSIEEGRCCRPINHPHHYRLCYDEDIGQSFDGEGWSNCSKAGYYITGVYRGSGAKWLSNIDKFRCCQMAL